MKQLLIIFLASFLLIAIWAQAPQKMSYQAVIRNSSNELVTDHAVGIKITLLQGSVSGAVVYTEIQTPTTNANGLISIEIGGGAGFNSINWAGSTYYIKTETDPTGGTSYTISGTSQLLSVPYALYAAKSGSSSTSWGTAGNAGIDTSINFIGTTDDNDIIFKRENFSAGLLSKKSTSFGVFGLNTANEGLGNTSYGIFTLSFNTNGSFNTANGMGSLTLNTEGNDNTAIGAYALSHNNIGNNNTAIGANALNYNTTGSYNMANGNYALHFNTTGINNTASGNLALTYNNEGIGNTADGNEALMYNTTGDNNTATGMHALLNNTTGSFNVANGEKALLSNSTGGFNTAIGIQSLLQNTVAYYNTAVGSGSLYNATGGSNTAIGVDALRNITSGANNIGVGWNAQVPNPTINDQVRIGNSAITFAGVQVAWTIGSDKRWKSDIKQSDLGLTFIKRLKPVSYIRLNDESKKTEYGFIAQEVEETLTSVGITNSGFITKDAEGMYNLRYNDFIAPMVKALQEQQEMIEKLLVTNTELIKRIEQLEIK